MQQQHRTGERKRTFTLYNHHHHEELDDNNSVLASKRRRLCYTSTTSWSPRATQFYSVRDVVCCIFQFLPVQDIFFSCKLVCKYWSQWLDTTNSYSDSNRFIWTFSMKSQYNNNNYKNAQLPSNRSVPDLIAIRTALQETLTRLSAVRKIQLMSFGWDMDPVFEYICNSHKTRPFSLLREMTLSGLNLRGQNLLRRSNGEERSSPLFSQLDSLHLTNMSNICSEGVNFIISNAPNLKNLSIQMISSTQFNKLVLPEEVCQNLEKLTIVHCGHLEEMIWEGKTFPNLHRLILDSSLSHCFSEEHGNRDQEPFMELFCSTSFPSLESVTLNIAGVRLDLSNCPRLKKAIINFGTSSLDSQPMDFIADSCSQLQELHVFNWHMQSRSLHDSFSGPNAPLRHVKHLVLEELLLDTDIKKPIGLISDNHSLHTLFIGAFDFQMRSDNSNITLYMNSCSRLSTVTFDHVSEHVPFSIDLRLSGCQSLSSICNNIPNSTLAIVDSVFAIEPYSKCFVDHFSSVYYENVKFQNKIGSCTPISTVFSTYNLILVQCIGVERLHFELNTFEYEEGQQHLSESIAAQGQQQTKEEEYSEIREKPLRCTLISCPDLSSIITQNCQFVYGNIRTHDCPKLWSNQQTLQ